ncbi:glucokinase [Chelatococcus asaccharovorans]|uniref:glucokinase n=1 Tax=Chelatococcus asaccharovorans TaxID=28210 RepID=UPI00224C6EEE|nr:glucokinase [Chelatococcus asaccharovorans]CAH1659889.1 Glucokinase [Chelatococcus asaccharovorans]CAH1684021.1 Glucokinase [Chelatococcus asaccharovorans]
MLDYPVLISDIGGTNARFAILPAAGAPARFLAKRPTADHADPSGAITAALQPYTGERPRTALLAVATRVAAPIVHLTNAAWTIDAERIGRDFGMDRVVIMNDYVPVAVALADPPPGFAQPLGPALPGNGGLRLVLGPGTGLGAAALVPIGARFAVLPTEAGHVEFGACDADEFAFFPLLERVHDRLTSEGVLSGPGMLRLYRALAQQRGTQPVYATSAAIIAHATVASDDLATDTLRLFARLLGRFAGDLALILSATGGVFIGGGIAPRMIPALRHGEFRAAFDRKAPFADVVRGIPTSVIVDPEPGLTGLAAYAAAPGRFITNLQEWKR